MPRVNPPQDIIRVWPCTLRLGTGAAQQVEWRAECSPTQGQEWSEHSATPKAFLWGREKVHGSNRIHKESLANIIWWQVLDGWRGLETSYGSPKSSAGISRCSCGYTIGVGIAWCSISHNRSANMRSGECSIQFNAPLSDLRILTTPDDIHSHNWRLVLYEDGWQMGLFELLSVDSGWIGALIQCSVSQLRSSCLTMLSSPRSSMMRNQGSPEWKCLI